MLVFSFIVHYPSREVLRILLITLLVCYFLGKLIKVAVDKIEIAEAKEENGSEESSIKSAEAREKTDSVVIEEQQETESDDSIGEELMEDPSIVEPEWEEEQGYEEGDFVENQET